MEAKHLEQPVSEVLSAEQVVNAYALSFYRALNPELASAFYERLEGQAAGIPAARLASLYRVEFSDIQRHVYNWLGNSANFERLGSRIRGLPALSYDAERTTTYPEHELEHLADLSVIANFDLRGALDFIALLYTMLEVFNNSHALSVSEQARVPASLATFLLDGQDVLPRRLLDEAPQLAPGIAPLDIYEAATGHQVRTVTYPRALWSQIEA